jgi:putative chitinase
VDGPAPPKRDGPDQPPDRHGPPQRHGALLLDNPAHQNHAMYATLLGAVNERDKQLGREPDEISRQLAGGLVEKARERGLDTIGAVKFTPDGTKVGMTDTADLSTPWAKTAVGDVGQLTGQKLLQSSENVAAINQHVALEQNLKPPSQAQSMQGPEDPTPKGPRLV